ncbi:MAG: FAD-dependent oxidoreductase [Desulfoprunum sp.]|jgi:heterodisulfide reductase subunit A|uniref:FAD-dependent oxidoreductase n=1 Tax=Desulfoprunum sp. TaxID=2020866 RepID=UPI00052CD0E4|nr:fumarate reductase [Desulfobulbus sp. Tol-SR]
MHNTNTSNNRVLVIGGGMAGIRTALDLAEAEKNVILVDRAYSIGGLMTQLDRTFPTNNCDLCTLSPNLSESSRQEHIELVTMTTVTDVKGKKGDFTVQLETAPRYINLDKCTACGECHKRYPEWVRFTPGLDHRAPTCMRYPQATPQAFSIDMAKCTDVKALMDTCPAGAINPDDFGSNREVKCASIVFVPGGALFDPSHLDYLGYAAQPDVVTSLEYERILSASGPTTGRLVRPSNGAQPKKVAWIQCVGSRGLQKGAGQYCSSACCMFALKEAIVTKERFGDDIETTIFYMDMRTMGKDYERYYLRARDEFGVRFVRSRPHSVLRPVGTDNLVVTYGTDSGAHNVTEEFDIVVLSTGFRVADDVRILAGKLGLDLNSGGFPKTDGFNPVVTSVPGVYVAGVIEAPKDIPETMVQASAAAIMAAGDLAPAAMAETVEEGEADQELLPPEFGVVGEEPRVGVFICDCGENIGGVIDAAALAEYAGTLPHVAVARLQGHGCSRESMRQIQQIVADEKINRVVIGGCSPRTHEAKFQEVIRKAGLNRYLLEIANIRDQVTWVHAHRAAGATDKAKDLIRMAVGSVVRSQPLADHSLPMNKDVLVVGGGVAGMTAALQLADHGHKVYLAERSATLGGQAAKIHRTLEGNEVAPLVRDLVARTEAHDNIQVITRALIVDHGGLPGMFRTGMQTGRQMFYRQIEHGVTILATGALPNRPAKYLLDECSQVSTQFDLQNLIEEKPGTVRAWDNVVMIQCVGSRTPDNPNCSRICCQNAVKNALRILEINPEARIFVLYRDMRTYGFQEEYYQKARQAGVIFVRYSAEAPPRVEAAGEMVEVTFTDPVLGREITVNADRLCLSTGLVADEDGNDELAMIFKIPRTADGYFLEDHVKLRPVDLPVPGFFVAGCAHGPKLIRESIAQALAASSRALTMLARDTIDLGARAARVDRDRCAACLICVRSCPFGIPFINADGYSEIDPAKCHGCGVCAAVCPAKAIQLMQFEDDRIMAKLEELFERNIA